MPKTIFSKVMWVGKATTFAVGLAVVLGLAVGVATGVAEAAKAKSLKQCQNGTVFGRAEIDGAEATDTLSTTGVVGNSDFICNAPSENVQVKREFAGHYEVVFGDVEHSGIIGSFFSPSPKPKPMVSSRTRDQIVSADGAFQCSGSPPPEILCYIVEVEDSHTQTQVDGDFTITIM